MAAEKTTPQKKAALRKGTTAKKGAAGQPRAASRQAASPKKTTVTKRGDSSKKTAASQKGATTRQDTATKGGKSPPQGTPRKASPPAGGGYVPTLRERFRREVVTAMLKRFEYTNPLQVPHLEKIVLNMGIGDAKDNPKALESAVEELTLISGQRAVVTRARKDISNFKIRKGFPVGCKVTLRGNRMYEFLERLISIALPRSRDFRGLAFRSFDGWGNYSFGIIEQIIFTEIDYDKIDRVRGLDVTLVTSAGSDEEAYWMLRGLGFPLREKVVRPELEAA